MLKAKYFLTLHSSGHLTEIPLSLDKINNTSDVSNRAIDSFRKCNSPISSYFWRVQHYSVTRVPQRYSGMFENRIRSSKHLVSHSPIPRWSGNNHYQKLSWWQSIMNFSGSTPEYPEDEDGKERVFWKKCICKWQFWRQRCYKCHRQWQTFCKKCM